MRRRFIKKITFIFFCLINIINLYPVFQIYFIYRNNEYYVKPINTQEYSITPFDPLLIIDQSQTHRLLLTSLEKSRLASLFFVGDKNEFNNIEIQLIYMDLYQIIDKINNLKISFSLGKYDNIIIHSVINFGTNELDIIDKLATAFTVKMLLVRLASESIEIPKKTKIKEGLTDSKIIFEYENFIQELKLLKPEEAYKYLTRYIELNFQLETKKNIMDSWIHPANLYYYKTGDYKSIAFFYYYTFKQIGFKAHSYLVSFLIKRSKEDIEKMYNLFTNKNNYLEKLQQIQELELQYKYLDPSSTITTFSEDFQTKRFFKPPTIFFYNPPDLQQAVFLITVEINNKWLYTTGDKWINPEITINSDRCCAHYAKNGCYYSNIEMDFIILNNLPINENEITWEIFYNSKD